MDNYFIYEENGQYLCKDYTTYNLDVKKGEKVSLIYKSTEKVLVKNKSLTGWCLGKYIDFIED